MPIASVPVLLPSAFLASVLALSGSYKLYRFEDYLAATGEFSVLRRLGSKPIRLVAPVAPAVEIGIAALLLLPPTNRVGLLGASFLVCAFLVVVAFEARPQISHCGCWGVTSIDVPKWAYLARNALLVAVALIGTAASTLPGAPQWSLEEAVVGVALMLPFALLSLELPQIAHLTVFERTVRSSR